MYVDRSVCSLSDYKLAVQLLKQTKQEYEAQQCKFRYCHSGFFVNPVSGILQLIAIRLQEYNAIIATQATSESKYQKLSAAIKQAIEQYSKQHPKHASQREQSLLNLKELLQKLELSNATPESKYVALSQAIIAELNAVEADHNKDNLSRMFTTSNLATAYMQVLRDNCIDPGKQIYSLEVELTDLVALKTH
jgi:hypothetical protein